MMIRSFALLSVCVVLACGSAVAQTDTTDRRRANVRDRLEQYLQTNDADNDGKLSREEAKDNSWFDRADTDDDDFVTLQELLELRGVADLPERRSPARGRSAFDGVDCTLDVTYADVPPGVDDDLLSLDIYAPEERDDLLPVLVMIHGGGWRIGDKAGAGMIRTKVPFFTGEGFVYVSINYRLSPKVRHPVHVQDTAAAIAWVHDNIALHGGDPDRLFIMGHSAGAHLAALVATDERRLAAHDKTLDVIKGAILLDGAAYDLPRMSETGAVTAITRNMYISAFGPEGGPGWKDASPRHHVAPDKGIPDFLILHINRRTARQFSGELGEALNEVGVPAQVMLTRGKTHSSLNRDIGRSGDRPTREVMAFLHERLDALEAGDGDDTEDTETGGAQPGELPKKPGAD